MLTKLKYDKHGWKVYVDIKILNMLQGQQLSFPVFLCEWDSRNRANHGIKKNWPVKISHIRGQENIVKCDLIDPSTAILSPLHIKLGLNSKQSVKG